MKCPSCGAFDVARLKLVCEACAVVILPNPEHIKPIVERVMDDIETPRNEAA